MGILRMNLTKKSYLRFLGRNKLYTAIMAMGLSVALALVIPLVSRSGEEGIGPCYATH